MQNLQDFRNQMEVKKQQLKYMTDKMNEVTEQIPSIQQGLLETRDARNGLVYLVRSQLNDKHNTTKIIFDDGSSVKISTSILVDYVPYFKTALNSKFADTQKNEIKLSGFTKEIFSNCLLFGIYKNCTENRPLNNFKNNHKTFNDKEFVEGISLLKLYYDKFDYLCMEKGTQFIEEIIKEEYVSNKLKELGSSNIYFEIA